MLRVREDILSVRVNSLACMICSFLSFCRASRIQNLSLPFCARLYCWALSLRLSDHADGACMYVMCARAHLCMWRILLRFSLLSLYSWKVPACVALSRVSWKYCSMFVFLLVVCCHAFITSRIQLLWSHARCRFVPAATMWSSQFLSLCVNKLCSVRTVPTSMSSALGGGVPSQFGRVPPTIFLSACQFCSV